MNRRAQHDKRSGDGIGELLRLAEPPSISPERTERHRQLARAHWQRKVRGRARRRRTLYGLAAAAVIGLAIGIWQVSQHRDTVPSAPITAADSKVTRSTAGPVARLATLAGSVQVDEPTRETAGSSGFLRAGAELDAGTVLETATDSRAAFRLAGGHELRLDVDTRLRLVSDRVLALERGALYIDSRESPGTLEIRTALGTARNIGTRFEVRLDDASLTVRVRDGRVAIDRDGETHEAARGAELTFDTTGTLARREIEVYGPQWRWSLEVAPPFDAEGRPISELLEWVTRETGWRLRLDPAVARGATTVTFSGSIEGLPPDEILDVVLPITGLTHRVEAGELIVEPLT